MGRDLDTLEQKTLNIKLPGKVFQKSTKLALKGNHNIQSTMNLRSTQDLPNLKQMASPNGGRPQTAMMRKSLASQMSTQPGSRWMQSPILSPDNIQKKMFESRLTRKGNSKASPEQQMEKSKSQALLPFIPPGISPIRPMTANKNGPRAALKANQ